MNNLEIVREHLISSHVVEQFLRRIRFRYTIVGVYPGTWHGTYQSLVGLPFSDDLGGLEHVLPWTGCIALLDVSVARGVLKIAGKPGVNAHGSVKIGRDVPQVARGEGGHKRILHLALELWARLFYLRRPSWVTSPGKLMPFLIFSTVTWAYPLLSDEMRRFVLFMDTG